MKNVRCDLFFKKKETHNSLVSQRVRIQHCHCCMGSVAWVQSLAQEFPHAEGMAKKKKKKKKKHFNLFFIYIVGEMFTLKGTILPMWVLS